MVKLVCGKEKNLPSQFVTVGFGGNGDFMIKLRCCHLYSQPKQFGPNSLRLGG